MEHLNSSRQGGRRRGGIFKQRLDQRAVRHGPTGTTGNHPRKHAFHDRQMVSFAPPSRRGRETICSTSSRVSPSPSAKASNTRTVSGENPRWGARHRKYLHMMPGLRTLGIGYTLPWRIRLDAFFFAELPQEIVEPYDTATPLEAVRANPIL